MSDVSRALRATGRRVLLVPTMGALPEGHLTLVRAAKRVPGSIVVVSRPSSTPCSSARVRISTPTRVRWRMTSRFCGRGCQIAFTPTVADMYPAGQRTTVLPGPLGAELEGHSRPTHFAGMLTVVLKLLQITKPDRAFFE